MTPDNEAVPVVRDLLPCPFCGPNEAVRCENWATWYVKCDDCGCQQIGLTADEAIAAWNTRAFTRQSAVGREEIAKLLADVELHLKSSRIFLTSREKMHPCGVDLHDQLQAEVSATLETLSLLPATVDAEKEREGWALVPIEPTEAMLEAAFTPWITDSEQSEMCAAIWSAMLAALSTSGLPDREGEGRSDG